MRISQPKIFFLNVGKGHLFQRVILAGSFEWKGILAFCDSVVPPPPIGPSCRGTQISLISSNLWNASLWEFCCFFEPNYEKSVGKGCAKITFSRWCPYSKGNFRWRTRVKREPCGCPLSPGARGFAHPEPIGVTPLSITTGILFHLILQNDYNIIL